jgi:hypothetical protein
VVKAKTCRCCISQNVVSVTIHGHFDSGATRVASIHDRPINTMPVEACREACGGAWGHGMTVGEGLLLLAAIPPSGGLAQNRGVSVPPPVKQRTLPPNSLQAPCPSPPNPRQTVRRPSQRLSRRCSANRPRPLPPEPWCHWSETILGIISPPLIGLSAYRLRWCRPHFEHQHARFKDTTSCGAHPAYGTNTTPKKKVGRLGGDPIEFA